MSTELSDIMHRNPVVADVNNDRDALFEMMKNKGIYQMPIIDADNKIVGVETLQHLIDIDKKDNPVFLMAGGFGKRLRPLTDDTPKPLLKVGKRPILETIIKQFSKYGFHNLILSTHYRAEMVREHFGDGDRLGVNIQYVYEDSPLGTAGSLGLLPSGLPDLPIVIMNGDLLTKIDFERLLDYHNNEGKIATMCVREYDFQVPYGVINMYNNKIDSIIEKPVHKFFVNAGIYIVEPDLLSDIDGESYLDMTSLLQTKIDEGVDIGMFPIHEYWLDIGRIDQFDQAQHDINIEF